VKLLDGIKRHIEKHFASVRLHRYVDEKGNFDYAKYRQVQTDGNQRKLHKVWAKEGNIAVIAEKLKQRLGTVEFGLCHGTRRGAEQAWFRQYLGCEVIGTEIADTALEFPHTVQWDFHEDHPDWIGRADFVYSNSFDHAYDPEKAFTAWMRSLKPQGVCVLEHSSDLSPASVTELDPFGVKLTRLRKLIVEWGPYEIVDEFDGPARYGRRQKAVHHLVIGKRS
jgi:hypothetical protein